MGTSQPRTGRPSNRTSKGGPWSWEHCSFGLAGNAGSNKRFTVCYEFPELTKECGVETTSEGKEG